MESFCSQPRANESHPSVPPSRMFSFEFNPNENLNSNFHYFEAFAPNENRRDLSLKACVPSPSRNTPKAEPRHSFSLVADTLGRDFDSESSSVEWAETLQEPHTPKLAFAEKRRESAELFSDAAGYELRRFVQSSDRQPEKVYQCEFCRAEFKSSAAKGGHYAKSHPNRSQKFKHRKHTYLTRLSERSRVQFLKAMKISVAKAPDLVDQPMFQINVFKDF